MRHDQATGQPYLDELPVENGREDYIVVIISALLFFFVYVITRVEFENLICSKS